MTPSSPVLVVLAAGLGSRFGGDKQVSEVGPAGETILDFTAFDARRAGFGGIVLVVRRDNRDAVAALVGDRIARHLPVSYAIQESAPGRARPWGTAHALASALRGLDRPCGVANADDWYAPGGIALLGRMLAERDGDGALVAYPLGRTLSANGPVNRAVCSMAADGRLASIVETVGIRADAPGLPAATPVSLNLWGFQPSLHPHLVAAVEAFVHAHAGDDQGECQLPTLVMDGCRRHDWRIRCRTADADWTGLTYRADHTAVRDRLAQACRDGDYPTPLWS